MAIKPTAEQAQRRLRIDDDVDLLSDMLDAIESAHAEMLAYLDRDALYEDAAALAVAVAAAQANLDAAIATEDADSIAAAQVEFFRVCSGRVITEDLITAQLLLADVAVGSNSLQEREGKQMAAENIMNRHRRSVFPGA